MSGSNSGLLLYRHILKAAKRFPSVKRDIIVQEIRAEFRANMHVRDEQQVQHQRKIAVDGLQTLNEFVGLDQNSSDWSVYLRGATIT